MPTTERVIKGSFHFTTFNRGLSFITHKTNWVEAQKSKRNSLIYSNMPKVGGDYILSASTFESLAHCDLKGSNNMLQKVK